MKLRKNQKVKFKAIDDFTGQELKLEGVVLDEAFHYVKTHNVKIHKYLQEEFGNILENEAYVIQENSYFLKIHLVFIEDILEVLDGE